MCRSGDKGNEEGILCLYYEIFFLYSRNLANCISFQIDKIVSPNNKCMSFKSVTSIWLQMSNSPDLIPGNIYYILWEIYIKCQEKNKSWHCRWVINKSWNSRLIFKSWYDTWIVNKAWHSRWLKAILDIAGAL